jgi:integrase/recombinase XerD
MRGDTAGSANLKDRGAIDEYIHTYYEDIEPIYREQIYKFGV